MLKYPVLRVVWLLAPWKGSLELADHAGLVEPRISEAAGRNPNDKGRENVLR